jgi:hypothetical protein
VKLYAFVRTPATDQGLDARVRAYSTEERRDHFADGGERKVDIDLTPEQVCLLFPPLKVGEWSTDLELAKPIARVLLRDHGGVVVVGYWCRTINRWAVGWSGDEFAWVQAWSPLPEFDADEAA